jgi:betaine-aldehyde dehydrogenase
VAPPDGRTSDVIDPSTGETYLQAPISGAADVDAALRVAAEAFESWRDSTPAERGLALLKFADAIEARAEELVEAESRNTGKPIALTRTDEVPPLADELRFFAGAARILEGKSAGE